MKKATKAPEYSVEILTASWPGLYAFLKKLQTIRRAHPVTQRLGRDGDGGVVGGRATSSAMPGAKSLPISAVYDKSYVAQYIGPLNRLVVPSRVDEYIGAMSGYGSRWWFTPDPIVITDEGHIINGQHRLLAAEAVALIDVKERQEAEKEIANKKATPEERAEAAEKAKKIEKRQYPQFVIVWGVDKRAAILMDEARRSSGDRRDIALRYAQSQAAT